LHFVFACALCLLFRWGLWCGASVLPFCLVGLWRSHLWWRGVLACEVRLPGWRLGHCLCRELGHRESMGNVEFACDILDSWPEAGHCFCDFAPWHVACVIALAVWDGACAQDCPGQAI